VRRARRSLGIRSSTATRRERRNAKRRNDNPGKTKTTTKRVCVLRSADVRVCVGRVKCVRADRVVRTDERPSDERRDRRRRRAPLRGRRSSSPPPTTTTPQRRPPYAFSYPAAVPPARRTRRPSKFKVDFVIIVRDPPRRRSRGRRPRSPARVSGKGTHRVIVLRFSLPTFSRRGAAFAERYADTNVFIHRRRVTALVCRARENVFHGTFASKKRHSADTHEYEFLLFFSCDFQYSTDTAMCEARLLTRCSS